MKSFSLIHNLSQFIQLNKILANLPTMKIPLTVLYLSIKFFTALQKCLDIKFKVFIHA